MDERPARSRKIAGLLLLFWPAVLMIGGYVAWSHWGADRLSQSYGRLAIEQIRIPPAPTYVRTNVLQRVYEDAGLDSISLLDHQAAAQIARAFETNAWVRKVDWVQKLSGEVNVHLTYRRPVAIVPIRQGRHPDLDGPGCYAIDEDSVVLPHVDFAPAETLQYLYILIEDVSAANSEGAPYGDDRVLAAAKLAGMLVDQRNALQIAGIKVVPTQGPNWQLVLLRTDGSTVIWGSAPGLELAGELPAPLKLQRLTTAPITPNLDLRAAWQTGKKNNRY